MLGSFSWLLFFVVVVCLILCVCVCVFVLCLLLGGGGVLLFGVVFCNDYSCDRCNVITTKKEPILLAIL